MYPNAYLRHSRVRNGVLVGPVDNEAAALKGRCKIKKYRATGLYKPPED